MPVFKKKNIYSLLVPLLSIHPISAAVTPLAASEQQICQAASTSVVHLVSNTKERLQYLARNNTRVLDVYDSFSLELLKALREGEISKESVNKILEAVEFSAEKHQTQTRKGVDKTPYIFHPIDVAYKLVTIGDCADADILIAALLHDTIEDTQTSATEIEKSFGETVKNYVLEVTDDMSLLKHARRKTQVEGAQHLSKGASLIRYGDKLSNISDLDSSPPIGWGKDDVVSYMDFVKSLIDNFTHKNSQFEEEIVKVLSQINSTLNEDSTTE